MKKTNLKTPLTIIIYFSFVVISFAQRLDPQQTPYEELRSIVETASRSQQKVWVEDFTGLN
ncbi:MAG: hypothetical protein QF780_05520 [Candidatus Marinimicrobia bacterium]|nr:hypothetical protein [Candidatus Neomarinimicrobiota bacterium]|tara:strand:+ start:1908 stop:2090 length:183 start_codon:yes stop_codon:yes gene_type:complete